jgi:CsoR family transcriptional regulator, copper-sensing transcriptional repressor
VEAESALHETAGAAMKGANHSAHLKRLKRVEGQVRGITRMVEEEVYCVDILRQIKAVRGALRSLESKILEEHLHHCVKDSVKPEKMDEVIALLKETQLG